MKTYKVRNGSKYYETAETRKLKRLDWIALPTKLDGKGYRRITMLGDKGPLVFAAWIAILEVAANCPERWVLADEDGPLDADDLSAKTGWPAACFELAFEHLVHPKIGWLEVVDTEQVISNLGDVGRRWEMLGDVGREQETPGDPGRCRGILGDDGRPREALGKKQGHRDRDRTETEQRHNREIDRERDREAIPSAKASSLFSFLCSDGLFHLLPEKLSELEARFPDLNVPIELDSIAVWCREWEDRRKKVEEMPKFLENCLKKSKAKGAKHGSQKQKRAGSGKYANLERR